MLVCFCSFDRLSHTASIAVDGPPDMMPGAQRSVSDVWWKTHVDSTLRKSLRGWMLLESGRVHRIYQ